MSKRAILLKCPVCGAPWHLSPEDILYTCESCGYTVNLETQEQVKNHGFIPAKELEHVKRKFHKFLESQKGTILCSDLPYRAEITEITLIYVPFWMISFNAKTTYRGYKVDYEEVSHISSSGEIVHKNKKIYIPVKGKIKESGIQPVLARYCDSIYGYKLFAKKSAMKKPESFDIKKISIKRRVFLDSEFGPKTAAERAKTIIYDRHREIAQKKCSGGEVFDIRTTIEIQETYYVHSPYYLLRYKFKNRQYMAGMDGIEGDVLIAQLPVSLMLRLYYIMLALLATLLGMSAHVIGTWFLFLGEDAMTAVTGFIFCVSFAVIPFLVTLAFRNELEYKDTNNVPKAGEAQKKKPSV